MATKKKTTNNKRKTPARRVSANKSSPAKRSAKKKQSPLSGEILFLFVLVFSILSLMSLFHMCGVFGEFLSGILFGLMGALAYIFPIFLTVAFGFVISNPNNRRLLHKVWFSAGLFLCLCGIFQWVVNDPVSQVWEIYNVCAENKGGGGFLGGLLSFELARLLGRGGALIVIVAFIILFFMLISGKLFFSSMRRMYINRGSDQSDIEYEDETEETAVPERHMNTHTFEREIKTEEPVPANDKKKEKKTRKKTKRSAELEEVRPDTAVASSEERAQQDPSDIHIIRGDDADSGHSVYKEELERKFGGRGEKGEAVSEPNAATGMSAVTETGGTSRANAASVMGAVSVTGAALETSAVSESDAMPEIDITPKADDISGSETAPETKGAKKKKTTAVTKEDEKETENVHAELDKAAVKEIPYKFPSLDLLSKPKPGKAGMNNEELRNTAMKLQETLGSFGVGVKMGDISLGPSVTRYELIPDQGVKVSRITGLTDDIKLSLAASDIRIEAPIPGKAAVGIEVPNNERAMITLRELLENSEFTRAKSKVTFAVGKDISGKTVVTDIAKMPHLLIAGATGSGKSVLINTLIMSILYKASPNDVKMIMVDPKMVELTAYEDIPHLMIPVVKDPKKASAALGWAVAEMTKRYQLFADAGVRDIKSYNVKAEKESGGNSDPAMQKMPQIVIIVDEFADLMMVAPGEVEDSVCRLAQLARAAGIHLVLATQRPSVNVITGLIKANIPSRIALSVSSAVDSRTIIDSAGAEKLLGNGDMLFAPQNLPKPIRVQGAFVSDEERDSVVSFLKSSGSGPAYNEEVTAHIDSAPVAGAKNGDAAGGSGPDRDELFIEAGNFIIEKDKASIGLLQRMFRIGFNRAARIMDQLADAGVVGPEEGTKARQILMTKEQFDAYLEGDE